MKTRRFQINNLSFYLNKETKNKINPKLIKISTEINAIEKIIETSMNPKSVFFVKITKTDKPLVRLIKKKREKRHITNNRNGIIT